MSRARTLIPQAYVFEDGGASFLARIVGHAGTAITQASISSLTYAVYDLSSSTPSTAVVSGSLTVSAVVYDTLQGANGSDARWPLDNTGYNFLHAMGATAFPTGGHRYQVEYKFTPSSGEVFWLVYEVEAVPILTS